MHHVYCRRYWSTHLLFSIKYFVFIACLSLSASCGLAKTPNEISAITINTEPAAQLEPRNNLRDEVNRLSNSLSEINEQARRLNDDYHKLLNLFRGLNEQIEEASNTLAEKTCCRGQTNTDMQAAISPPS
ncbi:hypothetical protein SG34_029905 [Thalassomonas viridans]|uniref:Uncharacterized protein n=1 Tax=Thalassomonas viridans TaxID=137584 RepID=A0AAF0CAU8_9GAMM|nr:hypothetical protein [Thalassomonas viridans]WDE08997.1 hypothetical protein SG34_029905 [Thalassomonas viridans]